MKVEDYKVGDKVRFTDVRPSQWTESGSMDKHLGKTVTITSIYEKSYWSSQTPILYFKFKDSGTRVFRLSQLVGLEHRIIKNW